MADDGISQRRADVEPTTQEVPLGRFGRFAASAVPLT